MSEPEAPRDSEGTASVDWVAARAHRVLASGVSVLSQSVQGRLKQLRRVGRASADDLARARQAHSTRARQPLPGAHPAESAALVRASTVVARATTPLEGTVVAQEAELGADLARRRRRAHRAVAVAGATALVISAISFATRDRASNGKVPRRVAQDSSTASVPSATSATVVTAPPTPSDVPTTAVTPLTSPASAAQPAATRPPRSSPAGSATTPAPSSPPTPPPPASAPPQQSPPSQPNPVCQITPALCP